MPQRGSYTFTFKQSFTIDIKVDSQKGFEWAMDQATDEANAIVGQILDEAGAGSPFHVTVDTLGDLEQVDWEGEE